MATFITQDEKRGTTTIRHSWRVEVFSLYGEDPEIRAHRQSVLYDTDTEEALQTLPDRIVTRKLSQLAEGPRNLLTALYGLTDQWETEDIEAVAATLPPSSELS